MKISIIIPTYCINELTAKLLNELCMKIWPQIEEQKHELIVVNDGSPIDICLTDVSKVVCLHENHGVAAARNAGLEVADGEWIAFFDADDMVPDDAIDIMEKVIKFIADDVDILQCKARHGDGNVSYPTPCAWGKLIRRSWIGDDRFDEDQLIGEEDTLFLKKQANIVEVNKVIYYHQPKANPDSLMKRYWRREIPRRKGTDQYA